MRDPAISVVTPVFNGAAHIGACIENVAAQNLQEIEHIIVDGGSTDGTLDVVREWDRRYPHIRLIEGPDRGQSDAMNKGIAAASADIIGVLNCDDYYEPFVLERAYRLMQNQPRPTLLVANCRVHNEMEGNSWTNRPSDLRLESLLMGIDYVEIPCNPSAYFYHKSVHDVIGPYDVDEHFAMDVEFILRAVRWCHTAYVDELWGNFRYHAGAKTARDKASGHQRQRLKRIYQKHRAQLPMRTRLRMALEKTRIDAKRQYWKACRLFGAVASEAQS